MTKTKQMKKYVGILCKNPLIKITPKSFYSKIQSIIVIIKFKNRTKIVLGHPTRPDPL